MNKYSVFVSHHQIGVAAAVANKIKEVFQQSNPQSLPVFVAHQQDFFDLNALLENVRASEVVIVLLTKEIYSRPYCLLEMYTAILAKKPIVPVLLEGEGYDFDNEKKRLENLDTILDIQARRLIESHNVDIVDMTYHLSNTLPALGAKKFNFTDESSVQIVRVNNILSAVAEAKFSEIRKDKETWLRETNRMPLSSAVMIEDDKASFQKRPSRTFSKIWLFIIILLIVAGAMLGVGMGAGQSIGYSSAKSEFSVPPTTTEPTFAPLTHSPTTNTPTTNTPTTNIPTTSIPTTSSPTFEECTGPLDSRFSTNGIEFGYIRDTEKADIGFLRLQSDEKIISIGTTGNGGSSFSSDFYVKRSLTNGSVDSTFGNNGIVIVAISNNFDILGHAILDNDSRTILVGGMGLDGTVAGTTAFVACIARVSSSGVMDNTFSSDGKATLLGNGASSFFMNVGIQSNNQIVAVGYTLIQGSYNSLIARYNIDGTLDESFDFDGLLGLNLFPSDNVAAFTIVQGKMITITGYAIVDGVSRTYLARVDGNTATLDSAFGSAGKELYNFSEFANISTIQTGLFIQPDGKIVVIGALQIPLNNKIFVFRVHGNGTVDSSFGNNGIKFINATGNDEFPNFAGLLPDGRIIVSGRVKRERNEMLLVRLTSSGQFDKTFYQTGKLIFSPDVNQNSQLGEVRSKSDGRMVAAALTSLLQTSGTATLMQICP